MSSTQVWFQNRRAKYRKQEKQLAKSLTPSAMACNGMMRSMYQHHAAAVAAAAQCRAGAYGAPGAGGCYSGGPCSVGRYHQSVGHQSSVQGVPGTPSFMSSSAVAAAAAAGYSSHFGVSPASSSSCHGGPPTTPGLQHVTSGTGNGMTSSLSVGGQQQQQQRLPSMSLDYGLNLVSKTLERERGGERDYFRLFIIYSSC